MRGCVYILLLAFVGGSALAQDVSEGPLVFLGMTIRTVTQGTIQEGVLLVRDGKFADVGPQGQVTIPQDAVVRNLTGKVVIPGLVDTHSHVGIYPRPSLPAHADGNEMTSPAQSIVRAIDAIWPGDPGIRMALAGGITTANIMPGSGNVIGGQTAYVKLRGEIIEEMLIESKSGVSGGMKMANGENPKRVYGPRNQAPSTRMAVAALQRRVFVSAQQYMKRWQAYEEARAAGKEAEEPERDLALEPLVEVLQGKRIVHFHTHRADDIMTVLRLSREFGFKVVLQHVTEGYKVAAEIARQGVPCSIILVDSPGGKLEAVNLSFSNGALLERAGAKVAFHTDDFIVSSRFFLRCGALAVREGMSEESALRALTFNAAEMLELDHRIGSIEVGKDADFVILSGPPFSVYTQVLETYIDGQKVFDRSLPRDRSYATGGFGVGNRYPASQQEKR